MFVRAFQNTPLAVPVGQFFWLFILFPFHVDGDVFEMPAHVGDSLLLGRTAVPDVVRGYAG